MKRNLRRKSTTSKTPQKKSPRKVVSGRSRIVKKNSVKKVKKMKTASYESPLRFLHQRKSKRQLIRDGLSPIQPNKKQKLTRKRESVIIINDENDLDSSRETETEAARVQKSNKILDRISRMKVSETVANDSVIILEDDQHQGSSVDLNQTEDVMVVWSSVTGSPKDKNENPSSNSGGNLSFEFDVAPNHSNLQMLQGNYPKKWLGNYLMQHEQKNPMTKSRNNKAENSKNARVGRKKKGHENSEETEKPKEKIQKAPEEILTGKLREIIIDGANVARQHAMGKFFSVEGLKIVIDYFKDRGHTVKAFVPQYERRRTRQILEDLNAEGVITFTPSRKAGNKVITPYDDRFILKYAAQCEGIVVSNDQFKDLYEEKPEWRETIENRILPPTFVGDILMFPDDPLGRDGPSLDKFLRHET